MVIRACPEHAAIVDTPVLDDFVVAEYAKYFCSEFPIIGESFFCSSSSDNMYIGLLGEIRWLFPCLTFVLVATLLAGL